MYREAYLNLQRLASASDEGLYMYLMNADGIVAEVPRILPEEKPKNKRSNKPTKIPRRLDLFRYPSTKNRVMFTYIS